MDRKTAIEQAKIKQFNALADGIDAAYVTVLAILAALPIPMLMPAADAWDIALKAGSLSRAWEMASEEPLLPMTIAQIRSMITAYFTAWEIAAAVSRMQAPAVWRLRCIEDALTRLDEAETVILRHLAGDFRAERLSDEEIAEANRIVGAHLRDKLERKR
jgi:hypothetical protein